VEPADHNITVYNLVQPTLRQKRETQFVAFCSNLACSSENLVLSRYSSSSPPLRSAQVRIATGSIILGMLSTSFISCRSIKEKPLQVFFNHGFLVRELASLDSGWPTARLGGYAELKRGVDTQGQGDPRMCWGQRKLIWPISASLWLVWSAPLYAQQPKLHATLVGHTEPVDSVAFSPDSKTLASGSWD
jgi:WD40 repeat protein